MPIDRQFPGGSSRPVKAAAVARPSSRLSRRAFRYELSNQSSAGESIEFPITSDLAFDDLRLLQRREDGTIEPISLYDGDGVASQCLDTSTLFLDSEPVMAQHPEHGAIVSAVLTGRLRPPSAQISLMPGKPVVEITLSPTIQVEISIVDGDAFTPILVSDMHGINYPAGTFGIVPAQK